MKKVQKNNNSSGFTLLEIMIVIVILGVLASFISGNFLNSLKKGRDAKRKSDLGEIVKALEMYYEDNRSYPTFDIISVDKLCQAQVCNLTKVYMQKMSHDPSKTPDYRYVYDPSGQTFRLFACLENSDQILPYETTATPPDLPNNWCTRKCYNPSNSSVNCVFALSDSNSVP